jgi:hypothetical protein
VWCFLNGRLLGPTSLVDTKGLLYVCMHTQHTHTHINICNIYIPIHTWLYIHMHIQMYIRTYGYFAWTIWVISLKKQNKNLKSQAPVTHAYNPSYWEAETGTIVGWSQATQKTFVKPIATNSWVRWYMPVIPVMAESLKPGQPRTKARPSFQNNQNKKGWRCGSSRELLPCKHKALCSSPKTKQEKTLNTSLCISSESKPSHQNQDSDNDIIQPSNL